MFLFSTALKRYEWYFAQDEYDGLLRRFSNQLPLFLRQHQSIWNNVEKFKLEYYLGRINFNGIPINGKIDQVLVKDGQAIIIDFKSGKGDSSSSDLKLKTTYKGNKGGDYWRQGAFYKFLLDNDNSQTWNAQKSGFLFLQANKLEPDIFKYQEYVYSDVDLQIIETQIKDTFTNINEHKFDQGCEKDDCEWCNYIKSHQVISNRR